MRLAGAPPECPDAARYTAAVNGGHVTFSLVNDACTDRRMILDRSEWRPAGEAVVVPERRVVLTADPKRGPLPQAAPSNGSWPSFRGPDASGVAEGQRLPD